ncbi:MAG: oligosaccharide flippase family protein [bacterium]|nr:oligosaccharide flippase family protein [bacterium]
MTDHGSRADEKAGGSISKRLVIRGAVVSTVGMVAFMAGQLGAAMLFTRALGEERTGIYASFVLCGDFLVILLNLGLWHALPKLVAAAPSTSRGRLTGAVFGIQSAAVLVVGLVIWGGWTLLGSPGRVSDNAVWVGLFPILWALPVYAFVSNTRENALAVLAGWNRYVPRSVALVLGASVNVALVWILLTRGGGGLTTLVLVALAAHGTAAVWAYAAMPAGRRPRWDVGEFGGCVAFSWPLYLNTILNFVFQRLDTLLIAVLLGPVQAAYFEFGAKRLAMYGARVLQSGLVPYLPNVSALVAQGDRVRASKLMDRASTATVVVCYLGALAGLSIREPLVAALFGSGYVAGLVALPLLLAAACNILQAGIMGQSLIALGKPRLVTAVNVVSAALSLGLNILLIPKLGMVGAGCAALVVAVFTNLAQTACVSAKGLRISWGRTILPHLCVVPAVGLALYGGTILWGVAGVGLFAGLVVLVRVVRVGDVWNGLRHMRNAR